MHNMKQRASGGQNRGMPSSPGDILSPVMSPALSGLGAGGGLELNRPPSYGKKLEQGLIQKVTAPTSYKDYMQREEKRQNPKGITKSTSLKVSKSSSKPMNESIDKSNRLSMDSFKRNTQTSKTQKPKLIKKRKIPEPKQNFNATATTIATSTADEFRRTVSEKFSRFQQLREQGLIDEEEESLLQDSLATPDRDIKHDILAEQKQRIKIKRLEEEMAKKEVERKKQENLIRLKEFQATQRLGFKAARTKQERHQRKQRQKSVEKALQNMQKLREQHLQEGRAVNKVEQSELQAWISKEMEANDIVPGIETISIDVSPEAEEREIKADSRAIKLNKKQVQKPPKGEKNSDCLDFYTDNDNQKARLAKHQLPGNNMLPDHESQKLGVRQDRFGTKVMYRGQDDFDRVVEIQKSKLEGNRNQEKLRSVEISRPDQVNIKSNLNRELEGLARRTGSSLVVKDRDDELKQDSIDSLDKVPTKEKSVDSKNRRILNQQAKKSSPDRDIPGIKNTKAEFQRQEEAKKIRENKAALVIQKRYRGYKGRVDYRRRKFIIEDQIEEDYGSYNDVKFNEGFNMQRYLREKNKLRKNNALGSQSAMEEIVEDIGESSSVSGSKRVAQSAASIQQSIMMQNFFANNQSKTASAHDPLSLINIFASRHGKPGEAKKLHGSISDIVPKQKSPLRRRKQKSGDSGKKTSVIEEEMSYSQSFEDSNSKSGSIKEEISGSGGQSSSNKGFLQQRPKAKQSLLGKPKKRGHSHSGSFGGVSRSQKDSYQDIEEDIPEESGIESNVQSDSGKIEEESHLHGSSFGGSGPKKSEEDSIIEEEYEHEAFESIQQSQSIAARNYVKYGLHTDAAKKAGSLGSNVPTTQKEVKRQNLLVEVEDEREKGEMRRKDLLNEVMQEMKEYESATVNQVVVDRMEKIVTKSLNQKDTILMGQAMAELELKRKHQEEITKIREEQINQMSQLMLLLAGNGGMMSPSSAAPGANQGFQMSKDQQEQFQRQRDQLMANVQQLISKPIEIKNETLQVNVNPSQIPQRITTPVNDNLSVSVSGKQGKKLSYLQQHELAKKQQASGIIESYGSDYIGEDIQISTSNAMGRSGKIRDSIRDSVDEIVDEVTSIVEDSMPKESYEGGSGSYNRNQFGKKFTSDNFDNFKSKQLNKLEESESAYKAVFDQVEVAIEKDKETQERKLKSDLRLKIIDQYTFDRKMRDVQRWAERERIELTQKKKKYHEGQDEMTKYMKKQEREKRLGQKPIQKQTLNEESEEEIYSDESDITREARAQKRSLKNNFAKPAESFNNQRQQSKIELANKLMSEKEAKIEEALKAKLKNLEAETADDMMRRAVELDIDQEVERRYNEKLKAIGDESMSDSQSQMPQFKIESKTPTTMALGSKGPAKKNVHFATVKEGHGKFSTSQLTGESIAESIMEDSQMSQSMKSGPSSHIDSHSLSQKKPKTLTQQKFGAAGQVGQQSESEAIESEIDSDVYSENFEESVKSTGTVSKSIGQSKNLLQAKAKAIEDSGYSQNFDEESLSQSHGQEQLTSGKKGENMNTVIEESFNEEQTERQVSSPDSNSHHKVSGGASQSGGIEVSGDDELPSADYSIKHSDKEIEWQLQFEESIDQNSSPEALPAEESKFSDEESDFARQIEDSQQEESEQEESIKTEEKTDEIDDFESVPDVVQSGSLSESADLDAKAALIAAELFNGMLDQFKSENDFMYDMKPEQPDEEDFKEKFPWTLDKKPEKVIKKPDDALKKVPEPVKKEKTQREIEDEAFKKKHEEENQKQENLIQIETEFLDFMVDKIDIQALIEVMEKPIEHNPLKRLAMIQAYDEDLSNSENDVSNPQQQIVLPQSFFNQTEREFAVLQRMKNRQVTRSAAEDSDILTGSQEENENIANTHHYSLFETLNEALELERPYQWKGAPMPWSKSNRVTRQTISHQQAKDIMAKAKKRVLEWGKTSAGTKIAPLPTPAQISHDDFGSEVTPPPMAEGEQERRDMLRQVRLTEVLTKDINETEPEWLDYEIQDTQTRFDLADMILTHLAGEATDIIAKLQNRKF